MTLRTLYKTRTCVLSAFARHSRRDPIPENVLVSARRMRPPTRHRCDRFPRPATIELASASATEDSPDRSPDRRGGVGKPDRSACPAASPEPGHRVVANSIVRSATSRRAKRSSGSGLTGRLFLTESTDDPTADDPRTRAGAFTRWRQEASGSLTAAARAAAAELGACARLQPAWLSSPQQAARRSTATVAPLGERRSG